MGFPSIRFGSSIHPSGGYRFGQTRVIGASASITDNSVGTVVASAYTVSLPSTTDYSWTATATGARKSAQAGYIDPVYFANHQNHKGCAIFEVSAAGDVDFYVERVLGETGSISTTISTFDIFTGGARAGTHYEAISETVTYTDGEIGWKKVTIPVTAIPTGFGVIGLKLSNYIPDGTGTARNEYCYIWLQGTGKVAGAKYLLSLGAGVESSADTSGDGTEGNPWRSPSHAATQMGNGGGVLYVSSANGSYADNGSFKESNNNKVGAFVFENLCTVTNPLICLPHPDNITPVVVDNGLGKTYAANAYFPGGYSEYLSKAGGISVGRFASHVWIVGINAVHGQISASANAYNAVHHIVLWKLYSNYFAAEGSNVHNIRFDSSYDCIFDSCSLSEAYTYQNNNMAIWPSNTAPFIGQVIPMAQSGSIQSFHSYGMRVIGCTVDNTEYGVFQKNAPGNQGVNVGYFTYTIKHCLFKRTKGAPIYFTNAGAGSPPTLKAVVGYCVSDGNTREGVGSQVSMVSIYMDGPASAQSDRIDVYNCVTRNNGFVSNLDADHVRYWNMISEDASWQYGSDGGGSPSFISRLEYGDHCLYVRGSQARTTNNYQPDEINYTTLAAWRNVNKAGGTVDNYVIMSEPDKNSTETSVTPAYTNAAAFDYRWDNTLGYGGQYVGLGHMTVGFDIIDVVVPPPPTIYYQTLGEIFANTLQSERYPTR